MSYPVDKDALWKRHAQEWLTQLRRIAAKSTAFRITYEHVVATDSAVIVLAQPSEPVNRIRQMIGDLLRLPSETRNKADLVHTTLFRYRAQLSDPDKFLARLEDTSADATAEVEELVVSKELVYPSLKAEVLGRLPLLPAKRTNTLCRCRCLRMERQWRSRSRRSPVDYLHGLRTVIGVNVVVADIYSAGDDPYLPHHGYTVDCKEDFSARLNVPNCTSERAHQSLSLRPSAIRWPWIVRRREVRGSDPTSAGSAAPSITHRPRKR